MLLPPPSENNQFGVLKLGNIKIFKIKEKILFQSRWWNKKYWNGETIKNLETETLLPTWNFHVDVVVDVNKLSQIFEFVKWWNISNVLTGVLTDILFWHQALWYESPSWLLFYIERVEKGSVVLRFWYQCRFLFFFLVVFAYSVLMIDLLWRPLEGFFLHVPNLFHPNPIQNPARILVDTGPVAVF